MTLLYVSKRGRNRANWLYVMAPNGTQQRPLGHARSVSAPAWSPRSRWLLYVAKSSIHCTPGGDRYLMRADGTRVRRLTHDGRCYADPTWAPDGRRIAYVSESKSAKAPHEDTRRMARLARPLNSALRARGIGKSSPAKRVLHTRRAECQDFGLRTFGHSAQRRPGCRGDARARSFRWR